MLKARPERSEGSCCPVERSFEAQDERSARFEPFNSPFSRPCGGDERVLLSCELGSRFAAEDA